LALSRTKNSSMSFKKSGSKTSWPRLIFTRKFMKKMMIELEKLKKCEKHAEE